MTSPRFWLATELLPDEYSGEIVAIDEPVLRSESWQRGHCLCHSRVPLQQQRARRQQLGIGIKTLFTPGHIEIAGQDLIPIELHAAVDDDWILRQIPGKKISPGVRVEKRFRQPILRDEITSPHRKVLTRAV